MHEHLKRNMSDTGKENAFFNAFRLAVTETARVQVWAGLKLMKEGGYDKYIWIAEPGACHICAPYNNQIFDMKYASMGNTLPPMHPFCRCSVAAYYDMDEERLYDDITEDVLSELKNEKTGVFDLNEVNIDGNKYVVDNKFVVLDSSQYERDIAKWIVSNIGGCVELHPRVLFPSRIRTPDYIWNGEKWDLKTINSHSKNTLTTAVKNIKKQANNVILDIRSDSYTNDVLNAELDRIYNNKRYDYLEKTMIIRCFKLIGIFKRKK